MVVHPRETKPGSRDIQRALLGHAHSSLRVVRQAYRLRPDHTDELLQLCTGREYWLAARLGDRTTVWGQNDRDAADDAFEERLLTEPGWREATAPQ